MLERANHHLKLLVELFRAALRKDYMASSVAQKESRRISGLEHRGESPRSHHRHFRLTAALSNVLQSLTTV